MLRRACPLSLEFATAMKRHEMARMGEMFRCIACDHKGDVDFVGARNVLTKTRAALERLDCPRAA